MRWLIWYHWIRMSKKLLWLHSRTWSERWSQVNKLMRNPSQISQLKLSFPNIGFNKNWCGATLENVEVSIPESVHINFRAGILQNNIQATHRIMRKEMGDGEHWHRLSTLLSSHHWAGQVPGHTRRAGLSNSAASFSCWAPTGMPLPWGSRNCRVG